MRPRTVTLVLVLAVVGILAFMLFTPAVTADVDAQTRSSAESRGWRSKGTETDEVGPMGLVTVTSTEYERRLGGVVVGKFYVASVKAPVWLPRSVLRDFTDEYVRTTAAAEGVALTPVAGTAPRDEAGAEVLEYKGSPSAGSVFDDGEVGVIARVIPCDLAGNVVIAAGFGAKSAGSGGVFAEAVDVYVKDVKGLLAPAVACP